MLRLESLDTLFRSVEGLLPCGRDDHPGIPRSKPGIRSKLARFHHHGVHSSLRRAARRRPFPNHGHSSPSPLSFLSAQTPGESARFV